MQAGFIDLTIGLIFLASLPFVWLWIYLAGNKRRANAIALGLDFSQLISVTRKVAVQAIVLTLLICALARPYFGRDEFSSVPSGRDILVLFDISKSMLSTDVSPSRLSLAKRKVLDLIRLVERESAGDRVGLVLFAGQGQLFCPLTVDYSVLRNFVNALDSSVILDEGSSLNDALATAATIARNSHAAKPLFLLISDGEDAYFSPQLASSTIKEANADIAAIGIGTNQGTPIPLGKGKFVRDSSGNIVISKLDEEVLTTLVEQNNGVYRKATLDDSDLESALNAGVSERRDSPIKVELFNEYGPFLLIALLLLFSYCLLSGKRSLILPVLLASLACFPNQGHSQESSSPEVPIKKTQHISPYQAKKAYQDGDYEKALLGFSQAYSNNPDDAAIIQGLASTLYRMGQYKEASELFAKGASVSPSGREKFESLFNFGNSSVKEGNFDAAINSYEEALKIKPKDEPTLANLEVAKKLKEEAQKQPTPPPQQQQKNESSSSSSSQNSNQNSSQNSSQNNENNQNQSSSSSNQSNKGNSGSSSSSSTSSSSSSNPSGEQGSSSSSSSSETSQKDQQSSSSQSQSSNKSEKQEAQSSSQQSSQSSSLEKEQAPKDQPSKASDHKRTYDPAELRENEAKSWLDSLPDSPVLLYKNESRQNQDKTQTW